MPIFYFNSDTLFNHMDFNFIYALPFNIWKTEKDYFLKLTLDINKN